MYRGCRTWCLTRYATLAFRAALFASVQVGSSQSAGTGPSQSVAITNVTVIDVVTGRLQDGVTVVTQGERIMRIGPRVTIPLGATPVNGKGKFLIPGLWDMHSHHQGTGADCLDLFVAKGVVGTRDMGGDVDFILPLREHVKSGAVLGPEIVASGPILDAPPSYPYRRRVANAQQAREAVVEWFTKAGFSPLQALQTATINPARFFGREDTQGTIELGKRADLILLDANPLVDIRNVTHVESVVVRGKLVTKQTIEKILASHRRASGAK